MALAKIANCYGPRLVLTFSNGISGVHTSVYPAEWLPWLPLLSICFFLSFSAMQPNRRGMKPRAAVRKLAKQLRVLGSTAGEETEKTKMHKSRSIHRIGFVQRVTKFRWSSYEEKNLNMHSHR